MTPTPDDAPKANPGPVSLILPIDDATANVAAINDWRLALDKLGRESELVVVDDGRAEPYEAKWPNVRVVRHDTRRGIGECLRAGIAATTHPLVVYAKLGYEPGKLRKVIEQLDQYDFVSAVRGGVVPPWLRKCDAVRRAFARVVFGITSEPRAAWRGGDDWRRGQRLRWQFGVLLTDPLSEFKGVRRAVLDRIVLQSAGDFVHAELAAKANFLGAMMAEVAVAGPMGAVSADYAADRKRVFGHPEFRDFEGANIP